MTLVVWDNESDFDKPSFQPEAKRLTRGYKVQLSQGPHPAEFQEAVSDATLADMRTWEGKEWLFFRKATIEAAQGLVERGYLARPCDTRFPPMEERLKAGWCLWNGARTSEQ